MCLSASDIKKALILKPLLFVWIFAFDFLYHGMLLMGKYEETSWLWRDAEQMQSPEFFLWSLVVQGAQAGFLALFFLKHSERNFGGLVKYGTMLGLFMGMMMFGSYSYMKDLPLDLASLWFAGGAIKGLGAGVIAGLFLGRGK